ncbi:Purine efflux pump PbuE [Methylobacterium crusticola]|uniref:Purine efflux pump PbuE n=1 Tax=Methylobacterium crusticola TaxID=1697972 RepID=A0ABQ4R6J0_9HYPH|nr:MFS transporter [Methylobacterium crusticola]GJD53337.1 Purine efflux pump PbuE [Methylobacterium crusticola]
MSARGGGRGFDPRVWLLALGTFAIGTDAFVVSGILPALADDLGVGLDVAGQVVSAYALTYALGAPFLAALTARLARERVVLGALGLFVLANALCALAPSYGFLIAARVLAGVAAALYTPTAYALAASLARPERRGAALAAVALGLTASTVLGVPLGALIGHALNWHATFWMVVVLSALAAGVLAARPPRAAPDTRPAGLASRFAPLARPRVLLALLPSLIWCTGNFTSYTYLGAALAGRYAPGVVAGLFLVYGLGGLVGSQLGGRLADRFGATGPILACLCVGVANQLLLGVTGTHPVGAGAALLVWSFCGWATFAPQQSRLLAIAPNDGPVVIALNNATIYLGSALGAGLGGLLIGAGTPATGLHWATAGLLAAALAVVRAGRIG